MRKVFSLVLLVAWRLCAVDTPEKTAWQVIARALQAGDDQAASALEMLGTIDDPTSRALIEATLKGNDAIAIGRVVAGLTSAQCRSYLGELERVAGELELAPTGFRHFGVLEGIARAGTGPAARILVGIATRAQQPEAGVAFGLLEQRMMTVAEPLLIETALSSQSPWSRETALSILRRAKSPSSLTAYQSALHDPDEHVRAAAALGLAQLGNRDGEAVIGALAKGDLNGPYQAEAAVGMVLLGKLGAIERLRLLVTSPDEAVRGRAVWAIARSGSPVLKEFAYQMGLDRQAIFRTMLAERLWDPSDPRDASALLEMITNGDEMSQLIGAERLTGTKLSARAEPIIASALASNSEAVRHLALKIASGQLSLENALAAQLEHGNDPAIQTAALEAIAHLHQSARYSQVVPYLASESRSVSAAAARTLAALDKEAAVRLFVEGVDSNNVYARIHSAAMLLAILTHKGQ